MFASSVQVAAPTDSGMCEYPRALRVSDSKTLGRAKEAATKAPKLLYDLPSYYNTGNFERQQQEQSSSALGAEAMKMALIGVAFRNAEMMTHIENHDMVNGMLVSHLKDRYGATPKDQWDFSSPRRHLLKDYGKITKAQILQWGEECIRWSDDPVEGQDQA